MLPGGDKLNDGQIKALAQGAIAHGLDPLNGEIWMIPGRGLMIGVKGLRKKAHEQVKGNFWAEFVELTDPDQRHRLRIPDGALAFECRLFDSENLRTYAETCEKLLSSKIPWEAVREMVGAKPYTSGYGVLKAGENTKMEPVQCAMKRAEADAIKRRFDVPFGLAVEADNDAPGGGEWVESTATPVDAAPEPLPADVQARGVAALYEDPTEQAADAVVAEIEQATAKVKANGTTRPYAPAQLKKGIELKAAKHATDTATQGQIGLTAGALNLCFAGEAHADEKRHSVQKYLTGHASMSEMDDSFVLALLDWLKPTRDSGGHYMPDAMAAREAGLIVRQTMKEAGQAELAL